MVLWEMKRSVTALHSTPAGVVSGGKDSKLRIWTRSMEPGAVFDMSGFGCDPRITSVSLSPDGVRVLVGTRGCDVFEISASDGDDIFGGSIVSGHAAGQTWVRHRCLDFAYIHLRLISLILCVDFL